MYAIRSYYGRRIDHAQRLVREPGVSIGAGREALGEVNLVAIAVVNVAADAPERARVVLVRRNNFV